VLRLSYLMWCCFASLIHTLTRLYRKSKNFVSVVFDHIALSEFWFFKTVRCWATDFPLPNFLRVVLFQNIWTDLTNREIVDFNKLSMLLQHFLQNDTKQHPTDSLSPGEPVDAQLKMQRKSAPITMFVLLCLAGASSTWRRVENPSIENLNLN
jgi:hypothetical protein